MAEMPMAPRSADGPPWSASEIAALQRKFAAISTSTAADVLRAKGAERLVLDGVRPMQKVGRPVSGAARTMRFLPARGDIVQPFANNPRNRLIDDVRPGEVLVFDAMRGLRGLGGPVFGDMTALRAHRAGAVALVTDAPVRDSLAIAEIGLPIFAAGLRPGPTPQAIIRWEADIPVQCGGALVRPGDWMLADDDGVLVIPRSLIDFVLEESGRLLREEEFCRLLLERGHRLKEAFPLRPALRPLFERYLRDGHLPDEDAVRNARESGH
jgi:regulator of RNase E activity RraA